MDTDKFTFRTKKTKYLVISVLLLLTVAFLMQACKQMGLEDDNNAVDSSASFSDTNAPAIISLSPAEKETAVPLNRSFSVTFSEAITGSSLTTNIEDNSCSGSFQVSSDDFNTCVQMSASPTTGNNDRSFAFIPAQVLDASTDYKIKVTTDARATSGQFLLAEHLSVIGFTSGEQLDQTAPAVTAVTPFNLYERIPLNTSIVITFNEPMKIPTLTTATTGTTCTGSVQLSVNSFASCVQMIADPEPAVDQKSFVITPADILAANRSYKLRITTAATDSAGNKLADEFRITRGLTTGIELDLAAPSITNITPANGFNNTSVCSPVTVRFSERMNPASISANITSSSCSNTIRLSADDFSSCIRLTSNITVVNAGRSFSFYPLADYSQNTLYKAKITVDARDLAGNPLNNDYYFASGYTTTGTPWDSNLWVE